MGKVQTWWVIKTPDGQLVRRSSGWSANGAWGNFGAHIARKLFIERGYRCVRVQVTEIKRKGGAK